MKTASSSLSSVFREDRAALKARPQGVKTCLSEANPRSCIARYNVFNTISSLVFRSYLCIKLVKNTISTDSVLTSSSLLVVFEDAA